MAKVLLEAKVLGLKLFWRGKCRDTFYVFGVSEQLLMIATDRISAFDVVLPNGIPDKGKILAQLSLFWFKLLRDICPNHIMSDDQEFCVSLVGETAQEENDLLGRCMLVHKAQVIPVECIVRKHLTGSALASYRNDGTVCGIKLPTGLREADELPEPIFTPSTKVKTGHGHDENIDFDRMVQIVGGPTAELLREKSLQLFSAAYDLAKCRGIIIADTKLEFGTHDGQIILVDELLTPDSSRFWPLAGFESGKAQPSFDKQYVRDWLLASGWDKEPPAPVLPEEVVEGTRQRYIEAFERLTGQIWPN